MACTTPPIPVVAALIERDGRVLVAQRPPHKHQGMKWEFPGGKVEMGEFPQEALRREIREEFGVDPVVGEALAETIHNYGSVCISLAGYRCTLDFGQPEPHPHEHIAHRWVTADELKGLDLAPADLPLAAAWSRSNQ